MRIRQRLLRSNSCEMTVPNSFFLGGGAFRKIHFAMSAFNDAQMMALYSSNCSFLDVWSNTYP